MKRNLIVLLLLVLILSACGQDITTSPTPAPTKNTPALIATGISTPTSTRAPTATATIQPAPTELKVATLTPFWLNFTPAPPTATPVPLAADDQFLTNMQQKEYRIITSGSLVGPGGYVYSAYVFKSNSKYLDVFLPGDWIVAFYVSDGTANRLISSYLASPYSKNYDQFSQYDPYPQFAYHLMNWDDPPDERYFPDMLFEIDSGGFDRQTLRLDGFTSDINQNGLPEFSLVGLYCPISQSQCELKYDFFEIRSSQSVVDLAANLPDHLSPYLHQADPPTFSVFIEHNFLTKDKILTSQYYRWEGTDFSDVTLEYAPEILADAEELRQEIEAQYGSPYSVYDRSTSYGVNIWQMLLFYENAGEWERGLEVFLEVTDEAHWPGTNPFDLCWLQISRAVAQDDYAHQRPFTIYHWQGENGPDDILQSFAGSLYDLSACEELEP